MSKTKTAGKKEVEVSFSIQKLEIPDLILVTPTVFKDERGFFLETYKRSDFIQVGIDAVFVQDNHSCSVRNVLRGIHCQFPPNEQGKLVHVMEGRVWDVAVDIRPGSTTFGKWVGVEMSAENPTLLWIPPGFAHGFLALSERVHLLYKCTSEYAKASEGGIRWDDPEVGIHWPVRDVIVSAKDQALPAFRDQRFS